MLWAVIGGSLGAAAGMMVFHHKTKKLKFFIGIPVIIMIHIMIAAFLFSRFGGQEMAVQYPEEHDMQEQGSITVSYEDNAFEETVITEEESVSLINPEGNTLGDRIVVPEEYERTPEPEGSFGEFLRTYPMEPDGSPILLFDGRKKTGHAAAVFSMSLGETDLQQCADSVIRAYAEYFRSTGQESRIAFHFVSGFLCDWNTYKTGKRISVNGNDVAWVNGRNASDSDDAFELPSTARSVEENG